MSSMFLYVIFLNHLIDKFFDTVLMRKVTQVEWYHFQQDWPMGTLRVDFLKISLFCKKFVDVVRSRSTFLIEFIIIALKY